MIVVPVERKIDWQRPPVVLITLVLINVLVFVFYQSNDVELIERAVESYDHHKLLDMERSAYRSYLRKVDPQAEYDPKDPDLIWYIASDSRFAVFIDDHQSRYIPKQQRRKWRMARAEVNKITDRISINAGGLDPSNINAFSVFTHQFLHGGFFHLLGNMVFLVLTGFAVEAALGSRKFLAYYLASGAGGGLLFAAIQAASGVSSGNLVGASGAISGVMAMYVVLYGMRKIKFFYWVLIFTGYFRAAAIIMLPAYILKECYALFFTEGSNIAYTAHIGGFITSAALVYVTRSVSKSAIDDNYLDGPIIARDPRLEQMQALYTEFGKAEFKSAWERLRKLKASMPYDSELLEIEFNLIRAGQASKVDGYLVHRFGKPGNPKTLVVAQGKKWRRMNETERAALSFEQKSGLLESFLRCGDIKLAEKIYAEIKNTGGRESDLAVLARQLAVEYEIIGAVQKSEEFNQQARGIITAGSRAAGHSRAASQGGEL